MYRLIMKVKFLLTIVIVSPQNKVYTSASMFTNLVFFNTVNLKEGTVFASEIVCVVAF